MASLQETLLSILRDGDGETAIQSVEKHEGIDGAYVASFLCRTSGTPLHVLFLRGVSSDARHTRCQNAMVNLSSAIRCRQYHTADRMDGARQQRMDV